MSAPVENATPGRSTWLTEADFVAAEVQPVSSIPGPGLPETALWTIGVLATQLIASVTMMIALLAGHVAAFGELTPDLLQDGKGFAPEFNIALFAGTQLIFVLAAIVAAALRLGGQPLRRLGLVPIPLGHLLLLLCAVLPIAMISGQFHWWAMGAWQILVDHVPQLAAFDQYQSMEVLKSMAQNASFPVLLAIIALAPAIGEELFFRGIIGRGLVARWGLPAGVLLTSLLFAAVHLHPAHAVALIPLAMLIHIVYFATRSILAPMLVHFLNNSLAIVAAKFPPQVEVKSLSDDAPISPEVFVTAVLCLTAVGVLIWKMRVKYILPDGSEWNPGYVTTERPPTYLGAVARHHRASSRLVALAAISLAMFGCALLYTEFAA